MKPLAMLPAALGFLPWFVCPSALTAEEPPAPRPTIDLQFPGGTVAEYVEAILKVAKDVNIVVMPGARDFEVPPLQLMAVDVGTAMELLHGRSELRGRTAVELHVSEVGPHEDNGRTILTVSSSVGPPEKEQPIEAGVWTISELLGANMKAQDILTAIQTAVDLSSEQFGPADIKFHDATGLIIAQGHVQQMHTIDQVIKRLRDGMKRPAAEGMSADASKLLSALDGQKFENAALAQRIAGAEEVIAQLQRDKIALTEEIAKRDARIKELEKLVK